MNYGTLRAIADRVAKGDTNFGRVNIKSNGRYTLLTYQNKCTWNGNWTDVERACRGLVVRNDGRLCAVPIPKFYNLGEPECPPLPDEPYTVWEKIDGSLAIFWYDDEWHCNTKGSFDNIYIDVAKKYWEEANPCFPSHWTVMCEVVLEDDEMQRAVSKEPGLYLLAVRDNYSGKDVPLWEVEDKSLPRAKWVNASIDELLERKSDVEGVEGWVVRFDSGFRVKIKTKWYLRMFRLIRSLTPSNVRDMMLEGDWIGEFPDDLQPEALQIQREIEEQLVEELRCIYTAYSEVAHIPTRKEYALTVLEEYPRISSWLFKLRDEKFIVSDVLENMEV